MASVRLITTQARQQQTALGDMFEIRLGPPISEAKAVTVATLVVGGDAPRLGDG
jgi:hypothetical protein